MNKLKIAAEFLAFLRESKDRTGIRFSDYNLLIICTFFFSFTFIQNHYFFDKVEEMNISNINSHSVIDSKSQREEKLSNCAQRQTKNQIV